MATPDQPREGFDLDLRILTRVYGQRTSFAIGDVPKYHESIELAWWVARKLREDHDAQISIATIADEYGAFFWRQRDGNPTMAGPTRRHRSVATAICQAALAFLDALGPPRPRAFLDAMLLNGVNDLGHILHFLGGATPTSRFCSVFISGMFERTPVQPFGVVATASIARPILPHGASLRETLAFVERHGGEAYLDRATWRAVEEDADAPKQAAA